MEEPEPLAALQPIAERDILSLLGMLDYLAVEVAKFDVTSAHRLILARNSLLEAVAGSLVKAH